MPEAPATEPQAPTRAERASARDDSPYAKTAYEVRLEKDNFNFRDKLRAARAEIATLKAESKAVPEGAVVLVGDEAKTYAAFQALNLAPDAIKGRIAVADAADAEKAAGERVSRISATVGPDWNGALVAELAQLKRFDVTDGEITDGDVTSTVPFAQPLDAAGKPVGESVPFSTYADTHLTAFRDALKAKPDAPVTTTPTVPVVAAPVAGRRPGVTMHPQAGAGAPGGTTREQVVSTKRADPMYAVL